MLLSDLENIIKEQNLNIVDLPINNNSIFTCIVHGLYDQKLEPMNISKDNHYPLSIKFENVRDSEEFYQPIFYQATLNMRKEIADFIKLNISQSNLNTELKNYKNKIEFFDEIETFLDNLINPVKSVSEKKIKLNDKIVTDSYIEDLNLIIAISAFYNININIYNLFDVPKLINASRSKEIFNIESKYNLTESKTLNLGFIGDYKFLLLNNIDDYKMTIWDKRIYYIVDIEYKSIIYNVVSYYESNNLIVVGVYNNTTRTWDSSGDEDVDEQLGILMTKYWEENSNDPSINKDIKISNYWVNSMTNEVFIEEFGFDKIGKLESDVDEDGTIEYFIDFK